MSLKIDRFESMRISNEIRLRNNHNVLIKDHLTDSIISFINLDDDVEENKVLAS